MCREAAVQCQHSMMRLSAGLAIVHRCNTGSHHRYSCGIFRLHVSTPKHYPPPRPRTWQRLVNMSAILEVNARSPCGYALVPVIRPRRLTKRQLVLTLIEASQMQPTQYPKGFAGPKTHRPQPSPPHGEGVRPAGCTSPIGSQALSAAHA